MIDHRLFVLQALAEHGTVTATADALNYTPSAVSAQLRGLAEQLGVALLEHEGRRVRLTPAARLLVERSADLNRAWEEILGEIAERADLEPRSAPPVRILDTNGRHPAHLATRLRARRPHLLVRIDEADPAMCFEMLLTEAADLAVVVGDPGRPAAGDPRFE